MRSRNREVHCHVTCYTSEQIQHFVTTKVRPPRAGQVRFDCTRNQSADRTAGRLQLPQFQLNNLSVYNNNNSNDKNSHVSVRNEELTRPLYKFLLLPAELGVDIKWTEQNTTGQAIGVTTDMNKILLDKPSVWRQTWTKYYWTSRRCDDRHGQNTTGQAVGVTTDTDKILLDKPSVWRQTWTKYYLTSHRCDDRHGQNTTGQAVGVTTDMDKILLDKPSVWRQTWTKYYWTSHRCDDRHGQAIGVMTDRQKNCEPKINNCT
jgi:hypothetical protein